MKQEFTAKTIDEARALAAQTFGVEESKIKFEIIDEPKKGLFGKVKGEAKLSAEYDMTKSEAAVCYIKNILNCMEMPHELKIEEAEDGATIDIVGEATSAIIGRRGETLDALQYLTSMIANKGHKSYYRISLDSCGYREKRKVILEELATKISKTVMRTGRTSTLEPMNPYERRIIHSTVAGIEGVISKSIGDEPFRKIIITPAGGARYNKPTTPKFGANNTTTNATNSGVNSVNKTTTPNKSGYIANKTGYDKAKPKTSYDKPKTGYNNANKTAGYGGKSGYNNSGYTPRRGKDELPTKAVEMGKSSFEKEYKRPKPEDDAIKGELYGKIDV